MSEVSKAETAAHRMGLAAGRAFRDTGIPSRNVFDGKGKPTLAAAWRRGYMAGTAGD
jgi:hypothetical protein